MKNGNGKATLLYGVIFTLLLSMLGAQIKQAIDTHKWRAEIDKRIWILEQAIDLPHPTQ